MTATTYQELKTEIRVDDLAHDPWGTGMSWLFSVCDVLTWERSCGTPDHWEFRAGIGPDSENLAFTILNGANDATLVRFGNLLERFTRAVKHAGKSY